MKKVIRIPEEVAVARLKKYIDECDGDEFAWLLGDAFGGNVIQDITSGNYDFEPNENYAGEFDDLKNNLQPKINKKKGVQ